MGLPKGKTNNLAGRPVGALNKITKDLRKSIVEFLENNFDEVISEWQKLEGKDKLHFYKDLIQYAIPKMQNIETSIEAVSEYEKLTDEELQKMIDQLLKVYESGNKN